MPSLAAFDYLWNRVGGQISNWVCMKDDRTGKHVIAFFHDDAHAKGVAKVGKEILALLAAKEPATD